MRKFLIVVLGFASLAAGSMTAKAEGKNVDTTPDQLKNYCKEHGGTYTAWDSGGTCSIKGKKGANPTVIACGKKTCMDSTQIFTPARATHGPIGGGSASTLGKGSVSGGASGGSTSAVGDGKSATKDASGNGAANASHAGGGTLTTVGTGGGNPPRNGRQLFRQQ